jgi:hypothetical protein
VNGEPLRDRNNVPIARSERIRILLPSCDDCNAQLNRRFEMPAKDLLRALFDRRGNITFDEREASVVGLWFVKTLLLQAHPQARYSDPIVERHVELHDLRWTPPEECPEAFYRWMVTGTVPPEGLSLWVFRTDESNDDAGESQFRVPLPIVTADGDTVAFNCFQLSLHGLHVTVVVHPGWPIDHPLERDGRAVRLWPHTGPVDLRRLPLLSRRTITWVRYRAKLRDGALRSPDLPALSASTHSLAMLQLTRLVEIWGM